MKQWGKTYRQEPGMAQYNYETRAQKYEFITGQHGGYYRHGFIDHAYLYNLYFPPKTVFTSFKNQIHNIVLNYPVAQDALAGLVGELVSQPAERLVVGNGASELIKIVSGHLARRLIVPVPMQRQQDRRLNLPWNFQPFVWMWTSLPLKQSGLKQI